MIDFKVYQASGYLTKLVTDASDVRKEYEEISGSLVQFDTPISAPLASLLVDINPVQSGSGEPSPTNIRPITGWTGANANVTGVNVWDEEWESGAFNGTTGEKTSNASWSRSVEKIPVLPNTSYYFYFEDTDSNHSWYAFFYDQNGSFIGLTQELISSAYTTPNNCYFINVQFKYPIADIAEHKASINYPSTDTDYHAYSGTTLSVTFPDSTGTVYGGTVDLVSGVLTVDRKLAVLTHTMAWEKDATNTETSVFFLSDAVVSDKSPASWDSVETIANWAIKSTEKSTEAAHMVSGRYYWTTADGYWRVGYGTPDTTVDEFKAFLQTNPLQVVCPITTPINYQLTPQEINTLQGVNNIWADTGDVSVKYRTH